MAKVDRFIATSFLRMKAPELQPFVNWLTAEHQEALELMSLANDPDMWRQLQGRAKLAKQILDFVKSSSELVSKLD